jgi:hypothetical protein
MVRETVARRSDAEQLADLLSSPEIGQLVTELAATRWTGRPGYPIRTMIGMALAKSLYTLPTWTRTVALVGEHAALRSALGCADLASVPSIHACYRFTAKLRAFKPLLDACLDSVTVALHKQIPELGTTGAIDASDMPAYGNGQKYLYKGGPERKTYSDPDATWGHRSAVSTRAAGSFYGYKLHQAVCVTTGLPLAWRIETAKDSESTLGVAPLQGLPDLGSCRSGGMGGDPPARVQLGGSDGPPARGHWCGGMRRFGCGWDGLPGQERPDSAPRITTAAMPVSAILRSTGSFSPPTLHRLPATRSLSAGWWRLPAVGQERSGPHAPRLVEQRHPDPPPIASFPGQAVPAEEPHPSTFAVPLLESVREQGSAPRSPSWTWATTMK